MKKRRILLKDQTLVLKVISGDIGSYKDLINRYEDVARLYIDTFVVDEIARENILQSVFINAYQKLRFVRGDVTFKVVLLREIHKEVNTYCKGNSVNAADLNLAPLGKLLGSAALSELTKKEVEVLIISTIFNGTPDYVSNILKISRAHAMKLVKYVNRIVSLSRDTKRIVVTGNQYSGLIGSRIIERIKNEGVLISPRTKHYILKVIIQKIVLIMILISSFFLSYAFNEFRVLSPFGLIHAVSRVSPVALAIPLAFILLSFALLEWFRVFYRVRLPILFLSLVMVVVGLSGVLTVIKFHERVSMSPLGFIYSLPSPSLIVGTIVEVRTENSFTLKTFGGETFRVYMNKSTVKRRNVLIEPGVSVFLMGESESDIFMARVVAPLTGK